MLPLLPGFVGGLPGGVELLIVLFIMFLLFGLPVALALFLGYRYVRGQSSTTSRDERIAELEAELETLREQVETASPADDEGSVTTGGTTSAESDEPTSVEPTVDGSDDGSGDAGVSRDDE